MDKQREESPQVDERMDPQTDLQTGDAAVLENDHQPGDEAVLENDHQPDLRIDPQADPQPEEAPAQKISGVRRLPSPEQTIALCIIFVVAFAGILLLASGGSGSITTARDGDVAEQMTARYERDTRPAARVDGVDITEGEATARVMTFRVSNGLKDEDAWSGWLTMQGMTPESVRSYVLERLVAERIAREEAEKMEIEVSDEQLSEQVAKNRANYIAGWDGASDEYLEERWTQAIAPTQMDGLSYEDQTRELLLEAEVAKTVALQGMSYAEWIDAQLAAREVEYLAMPGDLPYAL